MSETNGHIKHFVVDTNVLLHNPNAIFLFADNEVVIPFDVIEELDKFKAGTDDLGRNARTVIRHLDRLRRQGNLSEGVAVPQTGGARARRPRRRPEALPGPDRQHARQPHHLLRLDACSSRASASSSSPRTSTPASRATRWASMTEDFEAQKVDFDQLYTGWREADRAGRA